MIFLLIIQFLFIQIKSTTVYPWEKALDGSSFDERQQELLDSLRRNMRLVAFEDTFSETLATPATNDTDSLNISEKVLYIKNVVGKQFVARNAKDVNTEILSTSKRPNETAFFNDIKAANTNPESLHRLLSFTCGLFQHEYWTYEWCHRSRMSQFHMEPTDGGFVKAPNWSLGNYSRSIIVRKNGDFLNESAPIVKVIDFFVDGQHCDETNSGRRTEVHIQCCEGLPLQNYIPVSHFASHLHNLLRSPNLDAAMNPVLPPATLNSIVETELCSYKATVCTPLLCTDSLLPESEKQVSEVHSDESLYLEVMKTVSSTCVVRTEDWWTYEICFGKYVRQARYNTEQAVMPDGQVIGKQVLSSEYILGEPLQVVYNNITEIKKMIRTRPVQSGMESTTTLTEMARDAKNAQASGVSQNEKEILKSAGMLSPLLRKRLQQDPLRLVMEFRNGSSELCEGDTHRAVLVEVMCGWSDAIKSIFELSTCNYIIKVDLAVICKLEGFAQIEEKKTVIRIDPYFASDEERLLAEAEEQKEDEEEEEAEEESEKTVEDQPGEEVVDVFGENVTEDDESEDVEERFNHFNEPIQ
mmetsp:Transcript_29614/g.40696  ORF Transcript_29614/g.40696 Transcript_29614/m.40696 type:complete len:583 (-) Transcript_29614:57-1805(-)